MDQSETEPDAQRRVPTLVWVMLAVLVLVLFAAAVLLLGRPKSVMADRPASAVAAAARQEPVKVPPPTKLD